MLSQRLKETMINERECLQLCNIIKTLVHDLRIVGQLGVSPQTMSFATLFLDKVSQELSEGKKYLLEWAMFQTMMRGKK